MISRLIEAQLPCWCSYTAKQQLRFKIKYYFLMFLLEYYVNELLALISMIVASYARSYFSPLATQEVAAAYSHP